MSKISENKYGLLKLWQEYPFLNLFVEIQTTGSTKEAQKKNILLIFVFFFFFSLASLSPKTLCHSLFATI